MSRSRRQRALGALGARRALHLAGFFAVAGAAAGVACGGGTTASDDAGPAPIVAPAPSPTTPDAPDASDASSPRDARADAVVVDAGAGDSSGDADASDASADASDAGADASADAADAADAAVNDDPFDPASCAGPALTDAAALAKLGGAPRLKLADATLMRRTRACSGATPATCGPWGAPVVHTQALLTYSGGVVTDYKTFSFPTHLILYTQAGSPRFSVRHESDYRHTATTDARGVVFAFGAAPMVNTYPIIYVWDFAPAPNRYDDLQGLLGTRAELTVAERCARLAIANGVSTEIAALYKY
jgi:hypothetical protein